MPAQHIGNAPLDPLLRLLLGMGTARAQTDTSRAAIASQGYSAAQNRRQQAEQWEDTEEDRNLDREARKIQIEAMRVALDKAKGPEGGQAVQPRRPMPQPGGQPMGGAPAPGPQPGVMPNIPKVGQRLQPGQAAMGTPQSEEAAQWAGSRGYRTYSGAGDKPRGQYAPYMDPQQMIQTMQQIIQAVKAQSPEAVPGFIQMIKQDKNYPAFAEYVRGATGQDLDKILDEAAWGVRQPMAEEKQKFAGEKQRQKIEGAQEGRARSKARREAVKDVGGMVKDVINFPMERAKDAAALAETRQRTKASKAREERAPQESARKDAYLKVAQDTLAFAMKKYEETAEEEDPQKAAELKRRLKVAAGFLTDDDYEDDSPERQWARAIMRAIAEGVPYDQLPKLSEVAQRGLLDQIRRGMGN